MHLDKIKSINGSVSATTQSELVLGRSSVHDSNKQIQAYRLSFEGGTDSSVENDITHRVLNLLTEFGIGQALEGYDGFFEIPLSTALTDVLALLPAHLFVLELRLDIPIDQATVERLKSLKATGFRLAYAGLPAEEFGQEFLDLLDVLIVDPAVAPLDNIQKVMQGLKRARNAKLLAEHVESESDFDACRKLGFKLFEGKYFSSEALLKQKGSQLDKTALLQIVSQLMGDAEIKKLDQSFQTSPDLSIRLLKLVNSVGMGATGSFKITSLKQAIMRLGQKQLLRWIMLLLYRSQDSQPQRLLFKRVMFRGRFMELAAGHPRFIQGNLVDQAYIVGMLSLADLVTDGNLHEVIKQVGIDDSLQQAILAQQGTLGKLLGLARAIEDHQHSTIIMSARKLGLNGRDVSELQINTMKWLNSLEKQLN